jgi:hypothetical protein
VCAAVAFSAPALRAQELEPRAYAHTPVGLNFALAGYAYTEGDVLLDASAPIQGAHVTSQGIVLAYARSLNLWGDTGKLDAVVPYGWASGDATYVGQPRHREVDGFGDPTVRLSWNFIGAPALTLSEFRTRRPDWIVGASLRVQVPLGQYDNTKILNLGTNRWSFKPELGVSVPWRRWTFELATGVTFYTDNNDYPGGLTREQDPLFAAQLHAIYSFRGGIWAGFDGTFYEGGQSTINGTVNDDRQSSSRTGLTVSVPMGSQQSFKLYASTGATARVGGDFDTAGIVWQYRWGQ